MDAEYGRTCARYPRALAVKAGRHVGPRKLQLFTAAVCRRAWDDLDPPERAAVEAAERLADGELDPAAFQPIADAARRDPEPPPEQSAWESIWQVWRPDTDLARRNRREYARSAVLGLLAADVAAGAVRAVEWLQTWVQAAVPKADQGAAFVALCELAREVIGSPYRKYEFRPAFAGGGVLLPSGDVFHVTDTAHRIAEGAAADLAFDRLPVLADALDDAACPDEELVTHLRHGTGHVRGCWALDVVLGRS